MRHCVLIPLLSQDVRELIEMGMLYNNGKDKQGRPIVMVKFKYDLSLKRQLAQSVAALC
jgi:hypothetical protein